MAVYKRGYQRYAGPRTSRWTRFFALPRFAWRGLLQQRLVVIALIASLFWPTLCALFIYVSNHSELWSGLGNMGLASMLNIDARFFLVFLNWQNSFAMIVAALAGPGLVAPDLANNALPLYFSRPLTRWEYVLSRLVVLAGLLSLFTWVPGLALFFMQAGLAGWDWAVTNARFAAVIFLGSFAWILLVSLVALASSAWVKWRIVAGAAVLGFFFISAGAGQMVKAMFPDSPGDLLNPVMVSYTLLREALGMDRLENAPSPLACVAVVALLLGTLSVVLERKLRAVEVVR